MLDSSSDDDEGFTEYSELSLASGATALGSVVGSDLCFIKLTHYPRLSEAAGNLVFVVFLCVICVICG
jgi:hypothetical protein